MVKSGWCGIGALVRGSAETQRWPVLAIEELFDGRSALDIFLVVLKQAIRRNSVYELEGLKFSVLQSPTVVNFAALRLRLAWKGRDRGEF